MKVIVAGSRTINDYLVVKSAIEESGFEITELVSGHAGMRHMEDGTWQPSVDLLGEAYSWEVLGKEPRTFPADWKKFGKAAGMIRNVEMAKYADAAVIIWDGTSRGTAHMRDEALKRGLKVFVKEINV